MHAKLTAQAFAERAHACRGRLYGVAYGYLGNQADALEAIDDAIFRAYQKRHTLRQPEFFETWLTRIVINASLHILRKNKHLTLCDTLPEGVQISPDVRPLHEAVRQLEEPLRAVIVLRYFNGYTLEETAQLLQIPVGTVSTRQRRALAKLKIELEEDTP